MEETELITIDIPDDLYEVLEKAASLYNMSVEDYLNDILPRLIEQEYKRLSEQTAPVSNEWEEE